MFLRVVLCFLFRSSFHLVWIGPKEETVIHLLTLSIEMDLTLNVDCQTVLWLLGSSTGALLMYALEPLSTSAQYTILQPKQ